MQWIASVRDESRHDAIVQSFVLIVPFPCPRLFTTKKANIARFFCFVNLEAANLFGYIYDFGLQNLLGVGIIDKGNYFTIGNVPVGLCGYRIRLFDNVAS